MIIETGNNVFNIHMIWVRTKQLLREKLYDCNEFKFKGETGNVGESVRVWVTLSGD